jgi:hypothetical protein
MVMPASLGVGMVVMMMYMVMPGIFMRRFIPVFIPRMIMIVAVMIMKEAVIIMGNMAGLTFQFYIGMNTGYAPPFFPDKFQGPALKPEFGKLCPQQAGVDPHIHKCTQDHIP